ncbi:hypothetical protein BDW62DRAFT_213427 [Aspergillus aurantiobrunneus]
MSSYPSGHSANSLNRSSHTNCNTNDDWFRYTRGRFLFNEAQECQYVIARATESVGLTSAQCARVEEFPDGMFTKTFLFTMHDGTQVVGTVNKVATMDFVGRIFLTLTALILSNASPLGSEQVTNPGSESKAEDIPVGAEYIVMEKVAGVQLNSDRFDLVRGRVSIPEHHRFAVGPSTGREFIVDGRIALDFDRGPYPSIMSAFLWHPDLHAENIFVHPERPAEVLGIIDWQSSELLPLFDHARQPYFLNYNSPPSIVINRPAFPDGFDKLDTVKKAQVQDLYLKIFEMAQNLLIDREALYRSRCLDLEKEWTALPGVQASGNPPFPMLGMELIRSLRQSLGQMWPENGVVRPEQYDKVKKLLKQAKAELIDQLAHTETEMVAWEEAWPFNN